MNQDTDPQEPESQIPEEAPTQQQMVPFLGDDLAAAMTASGRIYVTLPGICAALGLDIRSQVRRIHRTRTLNAGLRKIALETRGGTQTLNCLSIDKVALWLAGIQTAQVSPDIREKIETYQDELAPVATRVFMRVMGIASTPPADPRLAALAEQYDVLMTAATFIADHMDDLAAMPDQLAQAVHLLESLAAQQGETTAAVQRLTGEQKVTPAQKQYIKDAVQRIADDSAGKPGMLTYGQVYAALYRQFHVSAYSEIPSARYDEVIAFLRDLWKRATVGTTPEQKSLF